MSVIKNYDPKDAKRKRKTINKKSELIKENPFDSSEDIKPAESMFSPKMEKYKLVAGKHNYSNIKHIDENGEIFIRRFTMVEEKEFSKLANSYTMKNFFEVINKTIETCIRSNVDINKLSMVEQLALFTKLFQLTYGDKIIQNVKCGECDFHNDVEIDISKNVSIRHMTENDFLMKEFELTTYDEPFRMWIKYPSLEEQIIYLDDTVDWAIKVKLLVDKIENGLENGYQVKKDDYIPVITNLNLEDKSSIRDYINLIADNFGIDFNIKELFICENRTCNLYNKPQNFTLEIERFFETIVKNIV